MVSTNISRQSTDKKCRTCCLFHVHSHTHGHKTKIAQKCDSQPSCGRPVSQSATKLGLAFRPSLPAVPLFQEKNWASWGGWYFCLHHGHAARSLQKFAYVWSWPRNSAGPCTDLSCLKVNTYHRRAVFVNSWIWKKRESQKKVSEGGIRLSACSRCPWESYQLGISLSV